MRIKRLALVLSVIALACAHASATGIAAVGVGVKYHAGSGTDTSTNLAYTPTTGNSVIIFADFQTAQTSPSCTDGTTTLIEGASTPTVNSRYAAVFTLASANSAHTAFKCSWTTSGNCNFYLFEYSGNTGGLSTTVTASSTSTGASCSGNGCTGTAGTTADISITLDDPNDWLVCLVDGQGNPFTMTVGNQRLNQTNSPEGIMGDNTAASGVVHCTATFTSSIIRMMAVELRLSATVTNLPRATIF